MTASGAVLYLLLFALLVLFWRKVRGRSFDDLLGQDLDLHERVHRVIAEHPRGGTWQEHKDWMRVAR
jgi:hypothetical protein